MPNIENLIDTIQQKINANESYETAQFTKLDLKNAYIQMNLAPEVSRHCNCNIVTGEYIGINHFYWIQWSY